MLDDDDTKIECLSCLTEEFIKNDHVILVAPALTILPSSYISPPSANEELKTM